MMKGKGLLMVLACVLILSGCASKKTVDVDLEPIKDLRTTEISEITEDEITIMSIPDLNTEEGIKEYLIGEWTLDAGYLSRLFCEMNVDYDLKVHLLFYDTFTGESQGEYEGSIELRRIYASPDEAPDGISFVLKDEEYPDNEYFFLHRTVYGGNRLMSLFFTGVENSVFNKIADVEDYEYMVEEIMLEKKTGEVSKIPPRKNDWFYATFWGQEVVYESIWIDDVWWTPPEEDYATVYPSRMTLYESNIPESVLYNIAPGVEFDLLVDGMEKGEVYYIETDENGNIRELINAQYKVYLEEEEYNKVNPEVQELIMDIIMDGFVEIEEYLEMGMSILFTEDKTMLDDEECYDIWLGTYHEEGFDQEIYYSVNIYTGQVYRYDFITDTWEELGRG